MPIQESIARPSFRVSDDMARLLTEAGGCSAAIKGLIYLGLDCAGYDVNGARKEIRRLAGGEHVAEQLAAALLALADGGKVSMAPAPAGEITTVDQLMAAPPAAAGNVMEVGEFV